MAYNGRIMLDPLLYMIVECKVYQTRCERKGPFSMADWKEDRIGSAERGENPTEIARMRSGFAVIGDTQFLPGYCLLLAAPQVEQLSDLPFAERGVYLQDMSLLGEAIMCVCRPLRVNYEILGNYDRYLHTHLFPRYEWEPRKRLENPVWLYPDAVSADPNAAYSEDRHGNLRQQLAEMLVELMRTHNALP
jgi:diadenosine tetraphosphate (Ap4A) HIT family hydrolase